MGKTFKDDKWKKRIDPKRKTTRDFTVDFIEYPEAKVIQNWIKLIKQDQGEKKRHERGSI